MFLGFSNGVTFLQAPEQSKIRIIFQAACPETSGVVTAILGYLHEASGEYPSPCLKHQPELQSVPFPEKNQISGA